ncbi:hypothetical protein BV509_03175 [Rhodovulum sulfidophilum]|uniref:Uncharacterized protein n=1 Tax=Rhodovulum visakhapatnamense TaxID=364297 RepID=A0A4R8G209_9RHOB|nr:hypothetical protein [Rhodovulum visakhapatnamense]MBL3569970.1 hypothetical protein [Rhodovulum visakhapatnamense]MBL3578716.1 hypothetical protein [Rhodovulum visakhapatnamense]OLS43427.1 hypothetical protein BV509_03175 [Rhodovulum sulfidophilum]TDX33278.1 hypothetical protein EV657_102155 [Rhodovulum visakhapatnamense]
MTAQIRNRGAAPVAHLCTLAPVERAAIRCLRGWRAGPAPRARIRRNLAQVFGPAAEMQEEILDLLMETALMQARRPLTFNALDHPEVTGDENTLAEMIAAAVGGERDDALVFALGLLGPHAAFQAVRLAEDLGLALLGLVRARQRVAPAGMLH